MKTKAQTASRLLLGLLFFVFGLNGFLNFIPPPPQMPEASQNFFMALMATKYFLPVLKGTEVLCGLALLANLAAPLALFVLAPIVVQIFLFHLFLTPGLHNLILPIVIIALFVTAAGKYQQLYRPLLSKG